MRTRRLLGFLLASLWLWPASPHAQSGNLQEAIGQGQAHYDVRRYEEAIPHWRRALELAEQELGADHLTTAALLTNLAVLYEAQARYATAEPLYQRALDINQEALGSSHPVVATSLVNLARLYDAQGRHIEAEPLYRWALVIRENIFGPGHPDYPENLDVIIALYEYQDHIEDRILRVGAGR